MAIVRKNILMGDFNGHFFFIAAKKLIFLLFGKVAKKGQMSGVIKKPIKCSLNIDRLPLFAIILMNNNNKIYTHF